jgi:hypothetical protein
MSNTTEAIDRVTVSPFNAPPSQVTKMVFMIVVAMMISTSAMAEWTMFDGGNQHRFYTHRLSTTRFLL